MLRLPAHTTGMNEDILRKKHTGEPGNGGQFSHTGRQGSGLTLNGADTGHQWGQMTPEQVDAVAAGEYEQLLRVLARQESHLGTLSRATNPNLRWEQRDPRTLDEITADAHRALEEGTVPLTWGDAVVRRALEAVEQSQDEVRRHRAVLDEADRQWQARGMWSRAFLVVGGGDGHVHSSMSCSTCNKGATPTQFQWMTGYSDAGEERIVADAGWRACTVCYPTAPVGDQKSLPTRMFSRDDEEKAAARAERERKAAERKQKAIAAGLTEDGSPLRVEYVEPNAPGWDRDPATGERVHSYRDRPRTEEFKTERTAVTWYTDYVPVEAVERLGERPWGPDAGGVAGRYGAVFTAIEQALAAKHGKTVSQVRAELVAKARKKHR